MAVFHPTTQHLDALKAILPSQVKRPAIPVPTSLQEAHDLYVWSQEDREKLLEVGLSPVVFDELLLGIDLLSYYQGKWKKEQKLVDPQAKALREKQQEARQLQQSVAANMRFAFRRQPELLKTLRASVKRTPYAALYQSLNDLAVLGEAHSDLLLAIGFNFDELVQARQLANDLPAWHASVSPKTNPAKELRDRAYAFLKKRVDELRTCGKYVFRQMPSRQRGYVSPFMRRKFQAEQRARSKQKE